MTEDSQSVIKALSLNERQEEAVLINDSHLLILAGAGSGKTRTIISKIVYDILVLGISPYNILAVTFTNKAADEMKLRLSRYIGEERAGLVTVKTFHSFGAKFLRQYGSHADLSPTFTIYDDADALSLLSAKYEDYTQKDLKPFIQMIFEAKERGYSYENYEQYINYREDAHSFFETYEKALRETGNVDLPELISIPTKILSSTPEIRANIQDRYAKIYVDEYQDTNGAQFAFLKNLVGDNNILCVVGDDDQSIYGFRGSEVEHILNFNKFFKNSVSVKLEENYRSTKTIVNLAASVIKNNKSRHNKTLFTNKEEGSKAKVYKLSDEKHEANFITNIIKRFDDYSSIAILYRTNSQSALFERVLTQNKIPYHILRGNSFYERQDIKDLIAMISLSINPTDIVAFMRVIKRPSRGIGDIAINQILDYAEEHDFNIINALENTTLTKKAREGANELINTINHALVALEEKKNADFVKTLLFESRLYEYYEKEDEKEGNKTDTHKDAFNSLIAQATEYEGGKMGILEFLEQTALVSLQDTKNTNGIALSTVHGVKGLEYDKVFITGLESNLFPIDIMDELEEERRLMYVAITRARRELYLTTCSRRFKWGRTEGCAPSIFLKELDKNYYIYEDLSEFDSSYDYYKPRWNNYTSIPKTKTTRTSSDKIPEFLKGSKDIKFNTHRSALSMLTRAAELENKNIIPSKPRPQGIPEDLPFQVGDRVIKDDIGEGKVVKIRPLGERYIMDIKFDSGRESVFPVITDKVKKI